MEQYTDSFKHEILEDWEYISNSNSESMREFCSKWDVPRSTFQGWLSKSKPLPADRFWSAPDGPAEPTVAYFTCGKPTADVLRMLASELSAIASDLNEIVNEL